MPVITPTEIPMSRPAHDRFERVIAEHYESLKPEVLATVRGKLAVDSLHPDPSDLDAAYNAAWHALYEQSRRRDEEVSNLGGWLAMITYRRAIDDIRRARIKYRAPVAVGEGISQLGYEHDVDAELADRQRYHQWLMSVRLRLNAREQQAVSLCVLHEHSRRDASDMMGIDIKRLDKIMVAANKKLGGLLEAINRGDWCQEQRSLIKAYALGLHEEGGERHELAVAHVMECQACAAYVRSLRGLAVVVPAPALLASAVGTGGGILGGLSGLFNGGRRDGRRHGHRCRRRRGSAAERHRREDSGAVRQRCVCCRRSSDRRGERARCQDACGLGVSEPPDTPYRGSEDRDPQSLHDDQLWHDGPVQHPQEAQAARSEEQGRAGDRGARHRAAGHVDATDEPVCRGLGAARSLRLRVRNRPLTRNS